MNNQKYIVELNPETGTLDVAHAVPYNPPNIFGSMFLGFCMTILVLLIVGVYKLKKQHGFQD